MVLRSLPVRAAGGVVVRGSKGGGFEVALIFRSTHGDWSFPKGKLEPGRVRALLRKARGRRRDGVALQHRGLSSVRPSTSTGVTAQRSFTTGSWSHWKGSSSPPKRLTTCNGSRSNWRGMVLTYEHDRELLDRNVVPALAERLFAARA